jgi:hypothetical protein
MKKPCDSDKTISPQVLKQCRESTMLNHGDPQWDRHQCTKVHDEWSTREFGGKTCYEWKG